MTLAVAHRGDPVVARENTLAAFRAAAALGADMVELDCRLSADGEVVVLHDETLTRLWAVDRCTRDLSWAQIRWVGAGEVRVPRLADVLDALSVELMVDGAEADTLLAALDVVRDRDALRRCVFVGDVAALMAVRDAAPAARIGLTWTGSQPPGADLLGRLAAELYNPRWDLLDAATIAAMHRRGVGVSTWTVDDRRMMARLASDGVDAVISNRIGDLLGVLGAPRLRSGHEHE